jgi:xylulokinase
MITIGLDIGTSGAKGVVVSFPRGKVLASARASYPLYGKGVIAEQEPEDWVRAARSILDKLLKGRRVDAIGIDGQMHSEVILAESGQAAGRAILWCDGRAQAQCDQIRETIGWERLRDTVANQPFAGFTLPHLLWRKMRGTAVVCKDYVRHRLTGELRQEISDAAGTLCWNVARGGWATELLDALRLRVRFPPPCASTEIVGRYRDVPVVGGAADNPAASVGLGTVVPGRAHASMGTSNVLFACIDRPVVDPAMRLHLFNHAAPGRFYLMGCMLTGTRALDWIVRDVLGWTLTRAMAEAEHVSSEGLVFAPYLVGERTPHADTHVRGLFAGLEPKHTGAHMVRAVLEGTAFALLDAMDVMREIGQAPTELRVTGGGMKSALWRQIIADVLQLDVVTVNTSDEGAAFGSAILAAAGAGGGSIEEICDSVVRETSRTRPRRTYDSARYKKGYAAACLLKPSTPEARRTRRLVEAGRR